MKKTRFAIEQIAAVLQQVEHGIPVAAAFSSSQTPATRNVRTLGEEPIAASGQLAPMT